jgi:hypothetical protein
MAKMRGSSNLNKNYISQLSNVLKDKNYLKKNTLMINSCSISDKLFNDMNMTLTNISEIPDKFDNENLDDFDNENENINDIIKINDKDNDNIINFDNEKDEISQIQINNNNLIKNEDEFLKEKKPEYNKDIENKISNPLNGDIEIKNIKRPFTIFLHYLKMKKDFDCINEKLNEFHYKVKIKVQIFCGGKEYTKPKTNEWRSKFIPKNKHIGKLIEFDLGYESLPMFASIVFKIKIVLFNNKKQPIHMDNFYWTNFKLFDHNRRLKTGIYIY